MHSGALCDPYPIDNTSYWYRYGHEKEGEIYNVTDWWVWGGDYIAVICPKDHAVREI